MTKYILDTYNALFEKQTHDLVGAVMISLIVSLASAGLYKLARRKAPETLVLSSVFLFVACLASMVLTLGYTIHAAVPVKKPVPEPVVRFEAPSVPRLRGPGNLDIYAANSFLLAADADRDGTLSPEEAAEFVRLVDADGKGSVDTGALSKAIWDRVGSKRASNDSLRPKPETP